MKKYESTAIRNVAILGHGDSGKTSLVSAMLFNSGMVNRLGKVDDGTAPTDFNEDEIDRKVSIGSAIAHSDYKNCKINLIDTPGYASFIHEAKSVLPAADAGLIVLCGVSGVEVMAERVFRYTKELHLPTAFVINKMDRDNASFKRVLDEVNEVFDRRAIALQIPLGEEKDFKGIIDLIDMKAYVSKGDGSKEIAEEAIPAEYQDQAKEMHTALEEMVAENDESLMELYFEAGELTRDQLISGLRSAVASRQLFPVVCSSATHNIGVAGVLDTIVHYLPDPLQRGEIAGADPASGAEKIRKTAAGEPFSAFVFKTMVDPFAGRISIFRVFSGAVKSDATVFNVNRELNEKFGALLALQGKHHESIDELVTGDIGAVAKLKETRTGDTLCDGKDKIKYDLIKLSEPVIAYALAPESRSDEEKVGPGLAKIQEEDLMIRSERDPQTHQLLVKGTGQMHIEVVVQRLKSKYNCNVILNQPKVPYKETITKEVEVHARHKKQSGGRGQFADCVIRMLPNDRDAGYEFIDKIFGGSIPANYRPAVDKGIREACVNGILAGNPLVDFKIELLDGKYHPVDSSEMAFKIAGSMAFKEAAQKAGPMLLEPIMMVEITVPDENTGDVMGDLSSRRGRPMGMDPGARGSVIKAQVPMSEMLSYAADLTSMTGGRGSFTMEFSHYDFVPSNIAEKIIAAAKKDKEEED